jgi:hypothetical protein
VETRTVPDAPGYLTPKTSPLDVAVAVDPFMRYTAATSLMQEVRVLQRYIRDVVIGKGHRGYVVRLQITLMPSQRNQPLDAYTTLSFFPARRDSSQSFRALSEDTQSYSRVRPSTAENGQSTTGQNLRVVPIMVSDNLEGAMESASTAALREMSFALLGMLNGVGLSGDAGRALERIEGLVGRQINSLLSVGQVSDNTLRIRFGAMNQPRNGLGLVPRNQTVTVLVVVPDSGWDPSARAEQIVERAVRIASRTDIVNATTGEPLRPQGRKNLHDRVDHALKQYDIDVSESVPGIARMIAAVQEGNLAEFSRALVGLRPDDQDHALRAARYGEAIWMDVGSIIATLPYTVTTARLPDPWKPHVDQSLRVLALDDGRQLVATLMGGASLRGSDLYATLPFDARQSAIAANTVTVDELGRVRVVFPSISGAGLCAIAPVDGMAPCKVEKLRLCRVAARWEPPSNPCWDVNVTYRTVKSSTPATSSPAFRLTARARVIAASDAGTGVLRLTVTKLQNATPDAKLAIRLDGADVEGVTAHDAKGAPVAVTEKDGTLEVASSTTLVLRLANLSESVPVVITGMGAQQPDRWELRATRAGRP